MLQGPKHGRQTNRLEWPARILHPVHVRFSCAGPPSPPCAMSYEVLVHFFLKKRKKPMMQGPPRGCALRKALTGICFLPAHPNGLVISSVFLARDLEKDPADRTLNKHGKCVGTGRWHIFDTPCWPVTSTPSPDQRACSVSRSPVGLLRAKS